MDFTNVQTALVLLPQNGDNNALKESSLYAALVNSSAKLTETTVSNLETSEIYDAIVTVEQNFSSQQLEQIFNLLKPNFYFYILKLNTVKSLSFLLKVSGFVVAQDSDNVIVARKPDYAVGSAVKIGLNGGNTSKKVWSIATEDDLAEDDLINDEDLLDEQDKVKPSADELRVCSTTKQRKACTNCSCGLKEELEEEEITKVRENSQNAKSSCGSCYLGDAFRCGGCPYRGMPAFKPGEKIVLDNTNDI